MSTGDLIRAGEALAAMLEAENAALAALDFVAASRLAGGKQAAADAFASACAQAGPAPASRALAARLAELAETNRVLLERAIAVQRRVVRAFARAALPPARSGRYGAGGIARDASAPAPVALVARA